MKKIYKIFAVFTLTIGLNSCSDSYFDVNTPSNSVEFKDLALKDMLAPTIYYTMRAQVTAAQDIDMFSQHIASAFAVQGADTQAESTTGQAVWNDIYLRSMANLKQIETKANGLNATHYKGIAHVLMAINLGLATDSWGDVPYSQAFQSNANLTPTYDSQQSIYTEINNLLTTGITELGSTDASVFKPGADDLIYQGNVSKWIKAAYTLKARYAMHLSKKNGGATTATAVLANLANGISSNAEDFQLVYNERNLNPWYQSQLGLNTGNLSYYISKYFISNMNGVNFPYAVPGAMDPRMLKIIDIRNYPNPTASTTNPDPSVIANYKGSINGTGGKYTITPSVAANAKIGVDFFYSKATSPVVLISFAEAQFLRAEAEFLAAGGTSTSVGTSAAANTAYLAGIGANMDKLGVTTTQKATYLTDASVNLGVAGLRLKNIMREKFTALFLTTESYNDQRRYNFSTDVFPGLTLPQGTPPANGGAWVRRLQYPVTELNTNPVNYNLNKKSMITPMWWDL